MISSDTVGEKLRHNSQLWSIVGDLEPQVSSTIPVAEDRNLALMLFADILKEAEGFRLSRANGGVMECPRSERTHQDHRVQHGEALAEGESERDVAHMKMLGLEPGRQVKGDSSSDTSQSSRDDLRSCSEECKESSLFGKEKEIIERRKIFKKLRNAAQGLVFLSPVVKENCDCSRKEFIDVPGLEVGEPKEENDNTV
ncbi:hypothetical protein HGM15179_004915 [Zosterops borbonicus]|uniref:Uncharacterized protein n=1 Tax=Zosterops borbonicus TaxID=364589 RepID=A0A8K1GR33_9PASS|nr:hypothetical protein HGM15179_004915 [Zosterops borbonicus]